MVNAHGAVPKCKGWPAFEIMRKKKTLKRQLVRLWNRRHLMVEAVYAKAGESSLDQPLQENPYEVRSFFRFDGFEEGASRDTHPNLLIRYLKNFGRNVKATGLYFLIGILLSALFQRYIPAELMTQLFGGNEAWGVLMAATIGVPLYVCGTGIAVNVLV